MLLGSLGLAVGDPGGVFLRILGVHDSKPLYPSTAALLPPPRPLS